MLVFVWASDRLAYVPAAAGDEIPVHVYYPDSAVGRASHLIIEDGLTEAEGAVIRRVWKQKVEEGQIANGQVDWKLTADARPEQPYVVKVFFDGHVYEKELRIGARYNSPVMEMYGDGDGVQVIELGLTEMKPFGFLPNIPIVPAWGMYIPAWMFVYLLVTIPFVFGLKGIFKIL